MSSELEAELKRVVVDSLKLEDITPEEIDSEAPFVGEDDGGLALDSIDFLELALAIEKKWAVKVQAGDAENEKIYRNVRTLAAHIEKKLGRTG